MRNVAAVALLRDLRLAKKVMGKSGRPELRKMKSPAKGSPRQKMLVRMSGLSDVNPEVLIREAEVACRFLRDGERYLLLKNYQTSIEYFFKASAVATNVIFASKVNGLKLPEQVVSDMHTIIQNGTKGIKTIMEVVAKKKVLAHEHLMHKAQMAARAKK